MPRRKNKLAEHILLLREDWDFERCPERDLYICWAYEFARESPTIVEEYKDALNYTIERQVIHPGFDAHGVYQRQLDLLDHEGEFVDAVYLELPIGFPDTPYLLTGHKHEVHNAGKSFHFTSVRNAEDAKGWGPGWKTPAHFRHLHISWERPDKVIIRDFGQWLKKNRPFPSISKRGKSVKKKMYADLKALGAARLLRRFTAREAHNHTQKDGQKLYQKVPDWYEARTRAKRVLKMWFRGSDEWE